MVAYQESSKSCLERMLNFIRLLLVVSPLKALMADQVEVFRRKGVLATYVTSKTNPEEVLKGDYELTHISPELLLRKNCYRMMGMSEPYSDSLVALVMDEAQCVKKWYFIYESSNTPINNVNM